MTKIPEVFYQLHGSDIVKLQSKKKKKDLRACPFFSKFIFSTFVALNFFEWGYENKS